MIEYTQISLKNLEVGCCYIGRGRGGDAGYWNGDSFMTICIYKKSWEEIQTVSRGLAVTEDMKNGREVIKGESYFYKDEESYYKNNPKEKELPFTSLGTFQPFLKIDFGEIVGENMTVSILGMVANLELNKMYNKSFQPTADASAEFKRYVF